MKLIQFRVRGFRCIHDTDYVNLSEASTLIGKNESGKTAILCALARLNKDQPLDEQDICDELVDYLGPEDRIVEGRFVLSSEDQNVLIAELPGISQLSDVVIFRTRGSKNVQYDFPGAKFPKKFACNEAEAPVFLASLDQLVTQIAPLIAAELESARIPARKTEEEESADEEGMMPERRNEVKNAAITKHLSAQKR